MLFPGCKDYIYFVGQRKEYVTFFSLSNCIAEHWKRKPMATSLPREIDYYHLFMCVQTRLTSTNGYLIDYAEKLSLVMSFDLTM